MRFLRYVLLLMCNMLFLMLCFAEHEKEVVVKKIRGEYIFTAQMNVTMKEAAQYAVDDAKHKALVKVCGEKISAWDMVEGSSAGESFNSLNMVQVDGEVVDVEIVASDCEQSQVRNSETVCWCIANVTVKKGVEPDPDFMATIKGVRTSYQVDEELTFSVLPYRDSYLKVFIFENADLGYRLYPNDLEAPFLLAGNVEHSFPTNTRSYYPMYTDKDIETDIMVFVFTKKERPFYEETTSRKEIEKWIARIPNNEKYVYYTSVNILKK